MFLTKKHLSRRTLLKGAGIGVALPLLDAMIPAATALSQTAAARTLRAAFFLLPHGAVMNNTRFGEAGDRWTPSGSGADFKFKTITQPLEPYKKYVTSLGNIKNDAAAARGNHGAPSAASSAGPPIHYVQPATWLSGKTPDLTDPSTPAMSETLDQVLARRIGRDTRFPSIQIAAEPTKQTWCNGPYSTMSFRDEKTPLEMEHNARKVFLQIVGDEGSRANRKESATQDASVLDLIREQTRALQQDLSPADRADLDQHLTAIRESEQRLESIKRATDSLEGAARSVGLGPMPSGPVEKFDEQVTLLFDLIAIAFASDVTRVATFAMASEGTNRTYDHLGISDGFHPLSHHSNESDKLEKLVKIQTWHTDRFAAFLGKLAAIREGEGTLLDNVMLLYGSNMSNSDSHTNGPLPTLLAGGAAGRLRGGRHLAFPEPTPIANLHLALLGLAGIEQKSFGNSTGVIAL